MKITITQLNTFVTVARAGNFSEAARTLGVAQSAVSQSVAALERDLEASLFERTSRSCRLTRQGEELLVDAERILKDIQESTQRIRRAARAGEHRLVVGLTGGLSALLTERLLNTTRKGDSSLDLTIMEGSVGRLRELMLDGRIDCAVTYNVPPADEQVKARVVAFEPMHLVAHPELMALHGSPRHVDLAQVARFPLFLPSITREAGAGQLLARAAQNAGVRLDIRYELQSTSIIRRLLMEDRLATVIGPGTVADDVAAGVLAARVIEVEPFVRTVCLALSSTRNFGPAESRFFERLQEIAGEWLVPSGLWRETSGNFAEPDYQKFRALRGFTRLP